MQFYDIAYMYDLCKLIITRSFHTLISTGENLSTKTLIRNGSVWTVDAATSLLTQTTTSLLQMENEYVQAVHKLTDMLSYKLQVLDNDAELEIVWDLVLQFRSDVNEIKRKKEEMEQLYSSVQKLMDISAEVAFIAGAEYASTCAGERLYSSQRQLELTRALTAEAEIQLNQVELKDIEATTKHHEKKEKEKSEQDKTDK
ncbi:hypothetical protein SNE40_003477 [Patella caerulea]|uniref:Direct IAP-binding protein with low pI n=2 Tax=Patella caerulea TaxID=87958 RepID=A0AAN8Q5A9_PATCE